MTSPSETVLRALAQARGDDAYRARMAWGNLPDAELDKEYGESGRTRRQIMAGYKAHEDELDRAVQWIKRIVPDDLPF